MQMLSILLIRRQLYPLPVMLNHNRSRFFLCIAAILLLHTMHAPAQRGWPRALTPTEKQVIEGSNDLGFRLFRQLASDPGNRKNSFISPLSISTAFAMVLNGARGATRDSIQRTLGLAGMAPGEINDGFKGVMELFPPLDTSVAFTIANSLWHRGSVPILPAFFDANRESFDAEVRRIGTPSEINEWVSLKTRGKIPSIIEGPIPEDLILYLINAIYFKGDWNQPFKEEDTEEEDFILEDGETTSCRMMRRVGSYYYAETPLFQRVELPYGNDNYRMTILLPKTGYTVDSLVALLSPTIWDSWIRSLSVGEIDLAMPKFTMEYSTGLIDPLKKMGMGIAFGPGADFSGITTGHPLHISEARHKTFVEVNEKGTEAAAVTIVGIVTLSSGVKSGPLVVRLDRPFLFAIREKNSGMVLFLGRMDQPAS